MIVGFKKQFIEPIMQGIKVHTIREDKGSRWKSGMLIQMYMGGRFSKEYRKFADKQCISIQRIDINWFEELDPGEGKLFEISIDDKILNFAQLIELAVKDGFDNVGELMEYFNKDFKGIIIHWTELKY